MVMLFCSRWSRSGDNSGSPHTCSTLMPCTTLEAPTESGIIGIAVIWTVGMFTRSSSFAIVAPQRLQLPQVATSTTAPTSASLSSSAMPSPIFFADLTAIPFPAVEKKLG